MTYLMQNKNKRTSEKGDKYRKTKQIYNSHKKQNKTKYGSLRTTLKRASCIYTGHVSWMSDMLLKLFLLAKEALNSLEGGGGRKSALLPENSC